ncbi:MAG: NADH-quinone oxidoreductase subunit J [Planctomycetes bacterium]|nr:NADH-quinone oxidoreductase subunit J [Planctomycetota bacterium]
METFLFFLFALMAVAGGVLTISRRNPLAGAISLVVTFLAVAGLYGLLQAPFVAVMQVLVYAGAIMVLVVFVIMLLNMPEEDLGQERISRGRLAVGLVVGVVLLTLFAVTWLPLDLSALPAAGQADPPRDFGSIRAVGALLFRSYLYPFEIVSILLLVAMIGAVLLAKRHLD